MRDKFVPPTSDVRDRRCRAIGVVVPESILSAQISDSLSIVLTPNPHLQRTSSNVASQCCS